MTRNFSNQRRDGQRPPSRNSFSSGRYREEESSRPARPRLNRDTVDRAWENGAPRRYADYRPRQNSSTPPTRRQGRPTSPSENFRSSQNRGMSSPRSERFRSSSPSSFEQRSSYGNTSETGSRPFSPPGHRAPARPGLNSERWTREQRNVQPEARNQNEYYRNERPPRNQQRGFSANGRGNARFERGSNEQGYGYREQENFVRGRPNNGPRQRREDSHSRWQNRSNAQNESTQRRPYARSEQRSSAPRQRYRQEQDDIERFKGDYEHFETSEQNEFPVRHVEKHVTPLPDGRVLKGSRPSQRKQAAFWNEVEEEAEMLRPQQSTSVSQERFEQKLEVLPPEKARSGKPARPHKEAPKVKTVKTARADKAKAPPKTTKTRSPRKAAGSGSSGPTMRPSQRGFKWPNTREEA